MTSNFSFLSKYWEDLALLGAGAEIPHALFREVAVVQQDKGHRRLRRHFLLIDAYLRLYPPGVQRPQIGGLLNVVVLLQALPDPRDVREILVKIQAVRRTRRDLPIC